MLAFQLAMSIVRRVDRKTNADRSLHEQIGEAIDMVNERRIERYIEEGERIAEAPR